MNQTYIDGILQENTSINLILINFHNHSLDNHSMWEFELSIKRERMNVKCDIIITCK